MNFGDLDLTGDTLQGAPRLPEGRHTVRCSEVKWAQKAGTTDWRAEADFESVDGAGSTRFYFNTGHHDEETRRIGRSQLKTFLTVANHPNPDRPGDVRSLKGLVCDVIVGKGKPFTGRDGKQVQTTEIKAFVARGEGPMSAPDRVEASRSSLNDAIPF